MEEEEGRTEEECPWKSCQNNVHFTCNLMNKFLFSTTMLPKISNCFGKGAKKKFISLWSHSDVIGLWRKVNNNDCCGYADVKMRPNLCVLMKLQACLQISFLESWNDISHVCLTRGSMFSGTCGQFRFHVRVATEGVVVQKDSALLQLRPHLDIPKLFELQEEQIRLSILIGFQSSRKEPQKQRLSGLAFGKTAQHLFSQSITLLNGHLVFRVTIWTLDGFGSLKMNSVWLLCLNREKRVQLFGRGEYSWFHFTVICLSRGQQWQPVRLFGVRNQAGWQPDWF